MALPEKFAFVTVMDVEIKAADGGNLGIADPSERTLTCLTMSNITQEGPRKEARGGRNAEPCVRYGKTLRAEMEDVVARPAVFKAVFGAKEEGGTYSFTNEFATSLQLVGKTQVVDKNTGELHNVTVTIHDFLPDSITDFSMESEGDIGVINIAGELFPNNEGVFYTIEAE